MNPKDPERLPLDQELFEFLHDLTNLKLREGEQDMYTFVSLGSLRELLKNYQIERK